MWILQNFLEKLFLKKHSGQWYWLQSFKLEKRHLTFHWSSILSNMLLTLSIHQPILTLERQQNIFVPTNNFVKLHHYRGNINNIKFYFRSKWYNQVMIFNSSKNATGEIITSFVFLNFWKAPFRQNNSLSGF